MRAVLSVPQNAKFVQGLRTIAGLWIRAGVRDANAGVQGWWFSHEGFQRQQLDVSVGLWDGLQLGLQVREARVSGIVQF